MKPKSLYTSPIQVDPESAIQVLAFVLTPARTLTDGAPERMLDASILDSAKRRAVDAWVESQRGRR